MPEAVTNTSPLTYLFHLDGLSWLESLFTKVWVPRAVADELDVGLQEGYDLPILSRYPFMKLVEPKTIPSESRYFLEMAVRNTDVEEPPRFLPSGYAALLTLYGLR